MKKLMTTIIGVAMCSTLLMTSASALALTDSAKIEVADQPVECIYEGASGFGVRALDEPIWNFSAQREHQVMGTDVSRVYGWSTCKLPNGLNVYHYSRARFEFGSSIIGDTDRVWGTGSVVAQTAWQDSFDVSLHTAKFYYGT